MQENNAKNMQLNLLNRSNLFLINIKKLFIKLHNKIIFILI